MFITTPSLEEHVPRGIAAPGSRYWLGVLLSTQAPWYLLAHTVSEPGQPDVTQTLAVAWESTLLDLLEAIGTTAVSSLSCVACEGGKKGHWTMRAVRELWSPSIVEIERTGPLLIRFRGEDVLRDSHQELVATNGVKGRELLLSLGDAD